MKTIQIATVLLISALFSACSNNSLQKKVTENKAKTPAQIMKGLESSAKSNEEFRNITATSYMNNEKFLNNDSYTRTEQKELKGLFPRLPNPDICMYVFPHLSGENATIPGYTSCFSMYEKNHYALPGETMTLGQSQL